MAGPPPVHHDEVQPSFEKQSGNRPPVAKWGAACSACAIAKAKCIRTNPDPGSKCDRCERLFKDCTGQIHRPRKKRQPKPSRTAQLEEKLNGLVNILKASGDLSKANITSEQLGIQLQAATSGTSPGARAAGSRRSSRTILSADPGSSSNPWAIPDNYNCYAPVSCICRPENGDAPPPPDSDEVLLNIYRNELQPLHPFVVIPPTMSAAALGSERPFLMAAVRMVASFRSLRSMRAQMYHLMKHAADRILIQSERSMDLLLGLIVILGWYHYHCPIHAQLTNLVSLASSLAGELEIMRPPRAPQMDAAHQLKHTAVNSRTNEERRAFAGVWFISSTMSMGYGRFDSMRFTRYLSQCLNDLEAGMEYDGDAQLVCLVRIQHLIERLAEISNEGGSSEELPAIPTIPTPREAIVSACQSELDRIRESIPPRLKSDRIIQTFLNTAALRLYEPPIVTRELVSIIAQSLNAPDVGPSSPLNDIYQSHTALTTWFDNWMSIPVSSYYCLTSPTCVQFVYAISRLGRWARLVTVQALQKSETIHDEEEDGRLGERSGSLQAGTRPTSGSSPSLSLPSSAPTPSGSETGVDRALCPYNPNRPDESLDPTLPVAVASVQIQLSRFPGLLIDIPGILSTIQKRFQDVSASLQRQSVQAEQHDLNSWSMNAIKIFLTRAKLEHWAELVAEGVEALSLGDKGRLSSSFGGAAASLTMGTTTLEDSVMGDLSRNLLQEGFLQDSMDLSYFYGSQANPWVNDMVQNGDASTWFEGYLNWGGVDDLGTMR